MLFTKTKNGIKTPHVASRFQIRPTNIVINFTWPNSKLTLNTLVENNSHIVAGLGDFNIRYKNCYLNKFIWAISFIIKSITRIFVMLNTMMENESTSFANI